MRKLAIAAGVFLLSTSVALAQNPVADEHAKAPRNQKNQGQPITGKTQPNTGTAALPVTTTGTANQNTPGADTEAGVEQQPGRNVDVPSTAAVSSARHGRAPSKTIKPPNPNEPGQNADAADINAQAASRAEIQPGTTLGVNGTPETISKPGEQAQSGGNLPQSGQSTQGRSGQAKNVKKTVAPKTLKKSPANPNAGTSKP